MTRDHIVRAAIPATVAAAFTLFAVPAFAQQRDRGRDHQDRSNQSQPQGRAVERAQPRGPVSTPRVESAPPSPRYTAPRYNPQPVTPPVTPHVDTRPTMPRYNPQPATPPVDARPTMPRYDPQPAAPHVDARPGAPRYDAPNAESRAVPRYEPRAVPRSEPRIVPHYESRGYYPRYESRGYYPHYESRGYYAPYFAPRYVYRPYVFRPRFRFGFGFYIGYPVPYAWSFPYPVYAYGYSAPAGPVVVDPGSAVYGGISLEITPPDAAVYVDGAYVGPVGDFDGTRQPLTLVAGRHHVEISAPGYEPMVFDVDVVPGQVIPYRGDLQPF
jgi:hypothetical protein